MCRDLHCLVQCSHSPRPSHHNSQWYSDKAHRDRYPLAVLYDRGLLSHVKKFDYKAAPHLRWRRNISIPGVYIISPYL